MTVAEIIEAARHYSQISGSTWYSETDALRSVNRTYRDIYKKILDANDEYFVTEITVNSSSLAKVRDAVYEYTLPADWYRLRSIRGVISNGEVGLERLDPKERTQREGYRYHNDKLRIFYRSPYDSFIVEYYPEPASYTATDQEIVYPKQLEPLIISYQMAIDIIKASKGDPADYQEEYNKLWVRFESDIKKRDDYSYPTVANVYKTTYPGW